MIKVKLSEIDTFKVPVYGYGINPDYDVYSRNEVVHYMDMYYMARGITVHPDDEDEVIWDFLDLHAAHTFVEGVEVLLE